MARAHAAPVIGADGTSARIAGGLHWGHTVSAPRLTWQTVHAKRGVEGDGCRRCAAWLSGVVQEDWAPDRSYPDAAHALCGAHLMRELPRDRAVKRPPSVRRLVARLIAHRDEVLRFVTDLRVSFIDNQSERDVRVVKLQQKIPRGWRTLAGAQAFLTVRSCRPPRAGTA